MMNGKGYVHKTLYNLNSFSRILIEKSKRNIYVTNENIVK